MSVGAVPVGPPPGLPASTLCAAFQRTARTCASDLALRASDGSVRLTWRQYAQRVRTVAGGLSALGVGHSDTVGLMLVNRPEFHVLDMAAVHVGAVPFSIYNTLPVEEIAVLVRDSGCTVLVTEARFLDRVIAACENTAVEHIVVVDRPGSAGVMSLATLETLEDKGFDFEAAWRAVRSDDVLTLIYTSGTTGRRKGVEITHGNMVSGLHAICDLLGMRRGGRSTSYLPSAHILDRAWFHYLPTLTGATTVSVADARQIMDVVAEVRPTYWGGVPRVWEKVQAALLAQGIADPSALTAAQRAAVVRRLGLDACRFLAVGAAPMPVRTVEYFLALGIELSELWGMSETAGIGTVNPPGALRAGTVGPPVSGMEARLLDDGELLVRGPMVMRGYRGAPDLTAQVLDADGWLRTGDVAEIDDAGYLKIVDRKKELIINAGGKNMSPAAIENKIKEASPLVGQVMAVGDLRPYNVALLVLDADGLAAFSTAHGIDTAEGIDENSVDRLAAHPKVIDEVRRAVAAANERLARVEQIKKFAVLSDEWTVAGGELTPTLKLRRAAVHDKYGEVIDRLYREDGGATPEPGGAALTPLAAGRMEHA
ncbi:AMP-dependent synthetase/ligase [Streptomyces sp. NPDC048636]|uniref:AMP-dependent synthetase/ligase n=1 Tax=Streptomyces sp. NPDC048636 TaxID=3155762 RepID=UPI003434E9F1